MEWLLELVGDLLYSVSGGDWKALREKSPRFLFGIRLLFLLALGVHGFVVFVLGIFLIFSVNYLIKVGLQWDSVGIFILAILLACFAVWRLLGLLKSIPTIFFRKSMKNL